MITLGIDLASQAKTTAACVIEWTGGTATVREVRCGVDDGALLDLVHAAGRVGIDVPLGWPDAFVEFVVAHRDGAAVPAAGVVDLRLRATDLEVSRRTRLWPLSVSSDRIAVPTFRAARLLSALAARGEPVDRAGGGKLVEAYPAAALKIWGFTHAGYKGTDGRDARHDLMHAIETAAADWLTLETAMRATCRDSADALDALVAALVARAAAVGLCEPIPPDSAGRAAREGWIALPVGGSLARLA